MNTASSDTQISTPSTGIPEVRHDFAQSPIVDRLRHATDGGKKLSVLMLADLFILPYPAMRCFSAAGAAVHVLGGPGASGLRYSRHCRSFRARRHEFSSRSAETRDEINASIAEHVVDLVVAGDHHLTRTLVDLSASLSAPCFPMPTPGAFDLLNNKWNFTQLCERLAIRCPRSQLVSDKNELVRLLRAGEIPIPCVAKPVDQDGSRGVVAMKHADDFDAARTIDYAPILVQDYVEGDDIGASVYCDQGRILAFIAHKLKHGIYATFESPEIRDAITKIVEVTKANGVLNFDMRIEAGGAIYWLECNPRLFYKIFYSMLAGINFAAFGLPHASKLCTSLPTGTNVRGFKAIAAELVRPWRLTSRDLKFIAHALYDPVPLLRQLLGFEQR